MRVIRNIWLGPLALLAAVAVVSAPAAAQQQRPNIVIIWGDDIGLSDVSAYSQGLMGFHTPNIDRIAREGVLFTDGHLEK
jgi:arylsulfatase